MTYNFTDVEGLDLKNLTWSPDNKITAGNAIRAAINYETVDGVFMFQLNTNRGKEWVSNPATINLFLQTQFPKFDGSQITKLIHYLSAHGRFYTQKAFTVPTIFFEDTKLEFVDGKWKASPINLNNYNPWNISKIKSPEFLELSEHEKQRRLAIARTNLQRLISTLWRTPELQQYALANLATCLMPYNFERAIFQIGEGRDGKSSIINLIKNILGDRFGKFSIKDEGRFTNANAEYKACRADDEGELQNKFNVELFKKKATGGELLIEKKGKDETQIVNFATLLVNSNHDINYYDTSRGTDRRLVFIRYENSDYDKWECNSLSESEWTQAIICPAFQHVFVEACLNAFANLQDPNAPQYGIITPESIQQYKRSIIMDNNHYLQFLTEFDYIVQALKKLQAVDLPEIKMHFDGWRHEIGMKSDITAQTFNTNIIKTLKIHFDIQTEKVRSTKGTKSLTLVPTEQYKNRIEQQEQAAKMPVQAILSPSTAQEQQELSSNTVVKFLSVIEPLKLALKPEQLNDQAIADIFSDPDNIVEAFTVENDSRPYSEQFWDNRPIMLPHSQPNNALQTLFNKMNKEGL